MTGEDVSSVMNARYLTEETEGVERPVSSLPSVCTYQGQVVLHHIVLLIIPLSLTQINRQKSFMSSLLFHDLIAFAFFFSLF